MLVVSKFGDGALHRKKHSLHVRAIKKILTEPTVLVLYDPSAVTKVSADASSYGIGAVEGAVLLQQHQMQWKPVAYASPTLRKSVYPSPGHATSFHPTSRERLLIEIDHTPLVPLLSSKDLDAVPLHILRFRLRLMRYSFTICYVPIKYLHSRHAVLSRSLSPTMNNDSESEELEISAKLFISTVVSQLPATSNHLKALSTAPLRRQIPTTGRAAEN